MQIAGRQQEIGVLQSLFNKKDASFVAVYGRRRVGKTYLIRQVYERAIVFECSGVHQKTKAVQLENFWRSLNETRQHAAPTLPPKTWIEAFFQLRAYLLTLEQDKKKVIFLDEIAWFDTPRSGFLAALDSFWNQFCTKRKDIILVICGSAASWIIQKVINDRGGLHNRLTHRVQLMPFNLKETKAFFDLHNIQMNLRDIALLYMCVGGIPFYLKDIENGQSVPQILDQLFFEEQATLKNEFQNLYAALFKNNELHERVVEALASKNSGLVRNDIIAATGIKSSGDLSVVLEELTQCGFIKPVLPINKTKEGFLYRLIDEFSLFYYQFLKNKPSKNSWQLLAQKPNFKIWSGYAFENLGIKHTAQLKQALGISGVITNEYAYTFKGDADNRGAQIDFIIDRADNCVNVFEMKFHNDEFDITKDYEAELRHKINTFRTKTRTKKTIFLTMLSVFGVKKNQYYLSVVTNQLLIEDLFI